MPGLIQENVGGDLPPIEQEIKIRPNPLQASALRFEKKLPKYKFATFRFILTEKASYTNATRKKKVSVRTIIGQPGDRIFNDTWELQELTDKIREHTYHGATPNNYLVEIYPEDIASENDTAAKEIGLCYFNKNTGVYVSENFNPDGFRDLVNILREKGQITGKNLESKIEQCPWIPQCSESKRTYYWVDPETKKTTWKPENKECQIPSEPCPPPCDWTEKCTGEPGKSHWVKEGETPVPDPPLGCREQKKINNLQCGPGFASNLEKGSCPWTTVCSSEYNKPYWVHSDGTTTWAKPSCVTEEYDEQLGNPCAVSKKGGRRKTRKNKKSKRKTKSRR